MADEKYKWLDATTRLISLTQQGKLNWTVAAEDLRPKVAVASEVFITYFKNRTLRLYARYVGVVSAWGVTSDKDVVLEFIDEHGVTAWRFPDTLALPDLLEAVQYKFSDVNDFIAELQAFAG